MTSKCLHLRRVYAIPNWGLGSFLKSSQGDFWILLSPGNARAAGQIVTNNKFYHYCLFLFIRSTWLISLYTSGRTEEADSLFKMIQPNSPWVHHMQLPDQFNTRLATEFPRPFLEFNANPPVHEPCIALRKHQQHIQNEFRNYESAVRAGLVFYLFLCTLY